MRKKKSISILAFVLLILLVTSATPLQRAEATTKMGAIEIVPKDLSNSATFTINTKDRIDNRIYELQLITGDRVIAYTDGKGNITNIAIIPANPNELGQGYKILRTEKGIYVLPDDLDYKKFDIELFNIKGLIEDGYYKESQIPLIIEYKKTGINVDGKIKEISETLKQFNAKVEKTFRIAPMSVVKTPTDPQKIKEFYKYLRDSVDIKRVWLDRKIKVNLQDSVPMIGATQVWALGYNGTGIKIAILDTGIAWDHPNFILPNGSSKVILNVNFAEIDSSDAYDYVGHGTHVAGIAAGLGVPDMDLAPGVAPGALLMNVKVLNDWGWGYWDWIMNGIEFAALGPDGEPNTGDEADIISMSLGGYAFEDSDPITELISEVTDLGVTVVVAAGNEGPSYFTVASPGIAKDAITVGAVDKYKELAWFSSRGPTPGLRIKPDVVAPGVSIYSSTPWGAEAWSGTSMATPHVSGASALIKQAHPDWTPRMIKDALVTTAEDLGYNVYEQGGGLINVSRAVKAKILIDPAVIDFGAISEGGVYEKNITIINLENATLTISLNVTTHDIIFDSYPNIAELSNYSLVLEPYDTTTITLKLNINPNLTTSLYEGKIIATLDDGEQYKAIFGFAKLNKVKLHAIDIYGDNASYEWVFTFKTNPANDIDAKVSSRLAITDENGTAVFYLTDGTYKFMYWGEKWDEDAPVYAILDNLTVTDNMNLTIDARETKEVMLDILDDKIVASKFTEVSFESDYMGWGFSNLYWYPATTKTYITQTNVKFLTDYEYYPREYLEINAPWIINTPKWYHLFFAYENVTPPIVQTATGAIAKSVEYVNPVMQEVGADVVQWAESMTVPGASKWIAFMWSYTNPQTRVEYLSPDAEYWYYTRKGADVPNEYTPYWSFDNDIPGLSNLIEDYIGKFAIGKAPILLATYPEVSLYEGGGRLHIFDTVVDAFAHGLYTSNYNINMKVFKDNTLIDNYTASIFGIYYPLDRNAIYKFIINATTNLPIFQNAITEIYFNTSTELSDNEPPKILSVYVDGLDLYNKHAQGQITGKILIEESNLTDLIIEYSTDGITWNPADIQLEESGYYNLYSFNFSIESPGAISLRIYAKDADGNYIDTRVTPAFFVKEKEESTISPLWRVSLNAAVTAFAGSKDGLVSVIGTADGNVIYIYRFAASKTKWSKNLGSEVTAVAVAEDGDFVAVATADGTIHYFNNVGTEKWSINVGSEVTALEMRGIEGDFIIAGTADGKVYYLSKYKPEKIVWNVDLGSPVTVIQISADGQKILAGTQEGTVYYINKYRTDKIVRTYNVNSEVTAIALVPSGDWALIGTKDGGVYYINTYNDGIKWSITLDSEVTSLAIVPGTQGALMVAGTKLGTVYYINKFLASKVGWSVSLGSAITGIAMSYTGDWVVASTANGKLYILNRWSNPHVTDVFVAGKTLNGLIATSDTGYIFGVASDGTVYYITR